MNVFAFRYPDSELIHTGKCDALQYGVQHNSFMIAPFLPHHREILAIKSESELRLDEIDSYILSDYSNDNGDGDENTSYYPFPNISTSRNQHCKEVEKIIENIKHGKISKCVAARVIIKESTQSPSQIFNSLCDTYHGAFIFLFHTQETGTWIGASPELLLKSDSKTVESMALASTRPAGSYRKWTAKEIKEQVVVKDYILKRFIDNGLVPHADGPESVICGPVEHLMTRIYAQFQTPDQIHKLVSNLSPTPALCGFPQKEALQIIHKTEEFERGYYGGWCGYSDEDSNINMYVNLRSLRYEPGRIALYVGGGIMEESDADSEWEETEIKSKTILNVINN